MYYFWYCVVLMSAVRNPVHGSLFFVTALHRANRTATRDSVTCTQPCHTTRPLSIEIRLEYVLHEVRFGHRTPLMPNFVPRDIAVEDEGLARRPSTRIFLISQTAALCVSLPHQVCLLCGGVVTIDSTLKMEDHPLPATDSLFIIFTDSIRIWRPPPLLHPQPEDASCRRDKGLNWHETFQWQAILLAGLPFEFYC
jgi:hypothetical protein